MKASQLTEQPFDDCTARDLWRAAKCRGQADFQALAQGLNLAAKSRSEAIASTPNKRHRQIEELYRAASRRRFEQAAKLLEELHPWALAELRARHERLREREESRRAHHTRRRGLAGRTEDAASPLSSEYSWMPDPPALRDAERRDAACEALSWLCLDGGAAVDGRQRPNGRRSRTFKPRLHAPEMQKHPEVRRPEREFIDALRFAWCEATGEVPPRWASLSRCGPFARFAQLALAHIGAPHANAVELINDIGRMCLPRDA